MPSNYTSNYHLSQWEKIDQVLMDDFNADNLAIEDALTSLAAAGAAEAAARTALNTALSKKGNVTLSISTYEGAGTYGSNNLTRVSFSRMPTMFLISGPEGIMIGQGGQSQAYVYATSGGGSVGSRDVSLTWSGKAFTFYDANYVTRQMNSKGTHYVFSFIIES